MGDAGESGLPRWAEPYLPEFRRILHAIDMADGFVLFPIEVPSPDVAEALASWLEGKGHPTSVVEPKRDEDWRHIVSSLLAKKPDSGGVVELIGSSTKSPQIGSGLRVLNQRRDSLARSLGVPLLWCGTKAFLDMTWRLAPDLWSVADVPRRIRVKHRTSNPFRAGTILGLGGISSHPADALSLFRSALAQDDKPNAVRIGLQHAEALAAKSNFSGARTFVDELDTILGPQGDASLRARVLLFRAKLSLTIGALGGARSDLLTLLSLGRDATTPEIAADALLTLGGVHAAMNRPEQARDSYEKARRFFASERGNARKLGDTLVALGDHDAKLGHIDESEAAYVRALSAYEAASGDPMTEVGRANVLLAQAELCASTSRFREAEAKYIEAQSAYTRLNIHLGTANTLSALGDLYSQLDRFEDAATSYEEALKILRQFGLPQWIEPVERALEAVRVR